MLSPFLYYAGRHIYYVYPDTEVGGECFITLSCALLQFVQFLGCHIYNACPNTEVGIGCVIISPAQRLMQYHCVLIQKSEGSVLLPLHQDTGYRNTVCVLIEK